MVKETIFHLSFDIIRHCSLVICWILLCDASCDFVDRLLS